MNFITQTTVDVFPISTGVFGFQPGWYENYMPQLIEPAYFLMVLLLVISIGIMVLRQFEGVDFSKKLWNVPIIVTVVGIWPLLVLQIKGLIDAFNTFLVVNIFQIEWVGFGFPEIGTVRNVFGWSTESLARLLPNLGYWVIYAFFLVFFFFFAALGPFVLAKGILSEDVDGFFELIKEMVVLLLWQTTLVILVAFIMPDIVSGQPFPSNPESNFYFVSFILGILIFFVPSITNKFSSHLGGSFFPPATLLTGAIFGITTIQQVGSKVARTVSLGARAGSSGMTASALGQQVLVSAIENKGHRQREQSDKVNEFLRKHYDSDNEEDKEKILSDSESFGFQEEQKTHGKSKVVTNLPGKESVDIPWLGQNNFQVSQSDSMLDLDRKAKNEMNQNPKKTPKKKDEE